MHDPGRTLAPAPSSEEVRRRLTSEVALPSRLGYTALLLAGAAAATVAASLLLTEQGLPARTRFAFGAMIIIGLAWVAFALWVLARRRVLYALHRLIAARMAVLFTAVFTASALVGVAAGSRAAALPTAVGAVMLGVALWLHSRARQRMRQLTLRREELERRLADVPPS